MILEIQRIAVICLFVYVYIHAQDVQNVGVNLEVKDLFANPDVDPFANMMSGSSATSTDKAKDSTNSQLTITSSIVKTERKTEGKQRKPVVDGVNLKTTKVATSTVGKNLGDSGVSGTPDISKSTGSASRSTSVTSRSSTIGTSGGTGSASTTVTRGGSGRATRIGTNRGSGRTTTGKIIDAGNSGTRRAGSSTRTLTRKTSVTTTQGSGSIGRRTTHTPVVNTSRGVSDTRKTAVRKSSASAGRRVIDTNRGQLRGTSGSNKSGTQASTTTTTVTRKTVGGTGSGTASSAGVTTRGNVGTSGSSTRRTNVSRRRVTGDGTGSSGTVTKTTTVTRTTSSRGSGSAQANNANINKSTRASTAGITRASNLAGSNTVRETRFGSTSTGDSNTRTSSNVERISTGSNAEMITVETAAVEPIIYIRTIYRDQRICENCIGDGTDCYLEHPDECRKYIRCSASSVGAGMEALEMNCAFGTFWSNVANTCDLASDVFCEKDACRDTRLKAYPSGINCRSYWRCVNGRSYAECCPHGEAYMDGTCVPSESCKVDDGECPFRYRNSGDSLTDREAIEVKQACQLEKVPGDITAFKMKNHWATMRCADSTRFDENKCTCVPHVFSAVQCKPTADLDFSAYDVGNRIRNYINANNVTNSEGYGLFNGRAYVSVPFFKNNENIGTHFVIRMRFYHDGKQGYDSQVLASNCKTRKGKELSPSFAILLAKTKRQIIFFASTKREDRKRYGATASLSLPFQPEKWTIVELQFLGEVLFAKVETLESDGTSNVVKDEKVLKGTLPTSVMPLMVGNCNMNDGFVGYIDQVKSYVCDPQQA